MTGGVFSGSLNATWPLARLTLEDDVVTVALRVAVQWFARLWGLSPVINLRRDEVKSAEYVGGRFKLTSLFSSGVRFRCHDSRKDGLTFWAGSGTCREILDLLAAEGFPVRANPLRSVRA